MYHFLLLSILKLVSYVKPNTYYNHAELQRYCITNLKRPKVRLLLRHKMYGQLLALKYIMLL